MKITDQIYQKFKRGEKQLFLLIDPDKFDVSTFSPSICKNIAKYIDVFLLGGSILSTLEIEKVATEIKNNCNAPVVLFPGSNIQLTPSVDAILFLSLISGRNPEYLIGQHVQAAPFLHQLNIEAIPTGYILVNGGSTSSVQYISNTIPIPSDKTDIAVATALAGKYLGLKMIYLEAGSGANSPVPVEMVSAVAKATQLPVIVGGGIKDAETAKKIYTAGASAIVMGTVFEDHPAAMQKIIQSIHQNKQ